MKTINISNKKMIKIESYCRQIKFIREEWCKVVGEKLGKENSYKNKTTTDLIIMALDSFLTQEIVELDVSLDHLAEEEDDKETKQI